MEPAARPAREYRVLVVEDDPLLRPFIADVLRDEGYAVIEAADGAEAITVLEQSQDAGPIALVVLDMHLPRLDGVAVLQRIADRRLNVPVVAMSAVTSMLTAARSLGACEAISKPFELESFLGVVARNWDTSREPNQYIRQMTYVPPKSTVMGQGSA